jgi:hypothetical protein
MDNRSGIYGNLLMINPFDKETAAIINFTQERRGRFAPAIQTLGLAGWVDELERRNNASGVVVLERSHESAGKPDLQALDLKRKIDRCYLNMIELIEAQILLQGEEVFATFVKTLNANINRYLAALSRRGGKKTEENNN